MAVFILTSAAGSPGVTTTAIATTMQWPESSLLIDADWQRAVFAGYLGGRKVADESILQSLRAIHSGRDITQALWNQTVPLPGDAPDGMRRLLLPGPPSPPGAQTLNQAWEPVAEGLSNLGRSGIDVIVDLGRMSTQGIPHPLATCATEIALVVHPTMRNLAASTWAAQHLSTAVATATKTRLLLIDTHPAITHYDPHEVSSALGLPVRARLPFAPDAAAVWSDGIPATAKRFLRSRYRSAIDHLANALNARARSLPSQPRSAIEAFSQGGQG